MRILKSRLEGFSAVNAGKQSCCFNFTSCFCNDRCLHNEVAKQHLANISVQNAAVYHVYPIVGNADTKLVVEHDILW